jgi:hypothetical protein
MNIDWEQQIQATNAQNRPWLHNTTQTIMEGRVTAMDDDECESWAMQIDAEFDQEHQRIGWTMHEDTELGIIYEEEEDEETYLSDKQMERQQNLIKTAVTWYKNQTMVRRLQRLITNGWLAMQVRLYLRNRAD